MVPNADNVVSCDSPYNIGVLIQLYCSRKSSKENRFFKLLFAQFRRQKQLLKNGSQYESLNILISIK